MELGGAAEPTSWEAIGEWWLEELISDPSYEADVTPLVLDLARPRGRVLDVGCGEGRLMKRLTAMGCTAVGVDIVQVLLNRARSHGEVIRGTLPSLPFLADAVFDGAIVSLVLEHIRDHVTLFGELARVVATGGTMTLVVNHPIYTAPGSAPIQEPDGEVLWRPGRYFDLGYTDEPAGTGSVRFHHRPLGVLLSSASDGDWSLEHLVELGATEAQIAGHPALAEQAHIPRLLGARWRRR